MGNCTSKKEDKKSAHYLGAGSALSGDAKDNKREYFASES